MLVKLSNFELDFYIKILNRYFKKYITKRKTKKYVLRIIIQKKKLNYLFQNFENLPMHSKTIVLILNRGISDLNEKEQNFIT